MKIMYVVEHDELDIRDNKHVSTYHNNRMLLKLNVHDKKLLLMIEMVMEEVD
jgi:hypothetical protein